VHRPYFIRSAFFTCVATLVCAWNISTLYPGIAHASPGEDLRIHAINVGAGDATFIEFPDGTTWLIDQGHSYWSGGVIHDYITSLGYNKLDYVVASHFDCDHIRGIAAISSLLTGAASYEHMGPKMFGDDSCTTTWRNTAPNRTSPSPGQTWNFGGASVECVCVGNTSSRYNYLIGGQSKYISDENDASLGFSISWGGFDYLTLGDLTASVENTLAPLIAGNNYDVLHVSHHGSSTSTRLSFCGILQPEVAVISVGASNSHGHPTEYTLRNLNGIGSSWGGVEWIYVTAPHNNDDGGEPDSESPSQAVLDNYRANYVFGDIVIRYDGISPNYDVNGTPYPVDEYVAPPDPTETPTPAATSTAPSPPTTKPTPRPTVPEEPTEGPIPPFPPQPILLPISIGLSSDTIVPGQTLIVSASVLPIVQRFDVYLAVKFPDGKFYFFSPGEGNGFTLRAYMSNIPGLHYIWSGSLLEIMVSEKIATGTYVFYAALFPSGTAPRFDGAAIGGVSTVTLDVHPTP
jgi:beta-lactamase superfamily II metal-dependent hydrolase